MNENERARIAAAVNQLRPDWPVASLMTMLNSAKMKDRPRRDVAVALAWVACESDTKTPARVLEHGPWWQAAGVDGGDKQPRTSWEDLCSVCSLKREGCDMVNEYADDASRHEYKSNQDALRDRATSPSPDAIAAARTQARDADRRAREVASEGSAA